MYREQTRSPDGKFAPKNSGETKPGAEEEARGLDALGATKNNAPVPGSSRIPDGKTADGQYVEIKSGGSVSNTEQVRDTSTAVRDATGKPLVIGTTNPNVTVSKPALTNPNVVVKPIPPKTNP
jgi:hypothetical protein